MLAIRAHPGLDLAQSGSGQGCSRLAYPYRSSKAWFMNTSTAGAQPGQTTSTDSALQSHSQILTRSGTDRMIAGVASGIAQYLKIDVLFVRIAFVILALVGGIGIPLYLACWLLIPDARNGRAIATDFADDVQTWRN
jgi:phage shock protein PspC (stress-responsive transcriptional regulator)